MAFAVIMPKTGMTMETGTIIHWLKQEGDPVAVGEPLLEIETDKVAMEIEAEAAGVLLRIIRGDGDEVPVTETIGYIGAAGEDLPSAKTAGVVPAPAPGASATAGVADSASGSPITDRVRATPSARRLAGELGVPLQGVLPSGPIGEVTAGDVRRAAGSSAGLRRPLTSMRRAIAAAVTLSQQIPQFTTHADACADGLRPGITSLIVRALALALRETPEMAIVLDGDEIVEVPDAAIGIAVSVPGGIVVPVIRGAAELSVAEVDAEVRQLVEHARGGVPGTHQASAGSDGPAVVTTISNLGMYGVSHFAPMLTPPQSSALGVGAVRSVPALVGGVLVERQRLDLALTVDHRIIDGAEAARFLGSVVEHLEEPHKLME